MTIFASFNPHIMIDNRNFEEVSIDREDEGFTIAKDLVEHLFCEMTKHSLQFAKTTLLDLPYTFSERSLDGILLPALSKLCKSQVLVEYPVTRRESSRYDEDKESSGRIDYWCIYKDYSFAIELKHSYDCFTTPETREDKVTSRWIKMNEQLESVKQEVKEYEENTKGIIRLGLHIITSYSDKAPEKKLIAQFKNSISDTFKRFQRDLAKPNRSQKPDLLICWKIPSRIVMRGEHTYPGLWCIAKIYPAIKHRGASR